MICGDFGVNADKIFINGNWFYPTIYGVFGNGGKATEKISTSSLE